MTAGTKIDVIAEFYDTFTTHDKVAALDVLRGVATLVLVGDKDRITPRDHSELIADLLDDADAEMVVVQGAGHMVPLEQPALVNQHLRALLRRAA
jgi:pimeloyl-ACP methyl ester carboxylesterase